MKTTTLKTDSLMWLLLVLGIFGLAFASVPLATAASDTKTMRVKGDFTLRFFPPGAECAPHPGACLKGTATGDLSGDVLIRVNNSYRVAGSARTVSVSNADISITRPDGRLDGGAAGFLDITTGEFKNVTPWVGGTGAYAEATGSVRVEGTDDLASGVEHSSYDGYLILPKK
jgi:hypothetical protein